MMVTPPIAGWVKEFSMEKTVKGNVVGERGNGDRGYGGKMENGVMIWVMDCVVRPFPPNILVPSSDIHPVLGC